MKGKKMKRFKNKLSRVVALVLAIMMVFSMTPEALLAASRVEGKEQVRVIVENKTYSVDEGAPWDGVLVDTWVDIDDSSTMLSCFLAALDEYGYTSTGAEMNYISEVNGLMAGEPDYMSGWMATINDWFINEGMECFSVAESKLEAGDEIKIAFSCLGAGEDLGGTWGNNDKSVSSISFSEGTLSPVFDSATYDYTLTLPEGTKNVVVTPTATNKNFQVRTSVNEEEYKRSDKIPVENGTQIIVKCGDLDWPTMNAGELGSGAENVEPGIYTINVAMVSTNNAPEIKGESSVSASIKEGESYKLDLSTVFTDADEDSLTYAVSVDGAEVEVCAKDYAYTPASAGSHKLEFVANDGKLDSEKYTVVLTVEEGVKGTEIPVENNRVDITNYVVGSISKYNGTATAINITGADVVSATEDGKDIYIVLSGETSADAQIKAVFESSVNNFTVTQSADTVTLADGKGTLSAKLTAKYIGRLDKGNCTYNIHFSCAAPATEPPIRLVESDAGEVYSGIALVINLKPYFKNASKYYLVQGDEMTELDGSNYTFRANSEGTYELKFAASNSIGTSNDYVTYTVEVTEVTGGIWVGKTTNNGSFNFVTFADKNGDVISGAEYTLDGTTINVVLPKTYDPAGKVTATFNLTQNDSGLPFLSTSNSAAGSGNATSRKVSMLTSTLKGGMATAKVYFYDVVPKATNNPYTTYTINYMVKNELPVLAEGQPTEVTATINAGEEYKVNVGELFVDADGDELIYYVSIDGATAVAAEADYSYVTNVAGEHTLVFTAHDGKGNCVVGYTVKLNVENSTVLEEMTIKMPEGLTPKFYVTNGFENGVDVLGDELSVETGATANGYTQYDVSYPDNADNISIRTEKWGGMTIATKEDTTVVLRKAIVATENYSGKAIDAKVTVLYSGNQVVKGTDGYLLVAGKEYNLQGVPTETVKYVNTTKNVAIEESADVEEITLAFAYKSPKTITVPEGATARLFAYNKYYDFTEIESEVAVNNGDGTVTFYFLTDSRILTYRASMEGKVTEAGYWSKNITIDFDNGENSPTDNASVEDNSVLVNVNAQNHLKLSAGESYKLKGYRAWEIIMYSYENEILTPDFNFNILSGEDVISLTPETSKSNGGKGEDSDWVRVNALKEGTAIIEVSYDAIDVVGGSWSGLYKETDANRTGLIVVTVGGEDTSVDFGIECFASAGSTKYNKNNAKKWDAEFDTLYFLGNYGELKLSPTASGAITEVAVSNNNGESYSVLDANQGVYTAKIISGNNIIRVTTENGVAYQVVRGDKITTAITEVSGASDGDGIIEAGETIRVTFNGVHTPIPKMAGNYNPGFKANNDGDSSVHIGYTFNNEYVTGAGAQYTFATSANYIEVTIPEGYDEEQISLTDGYIATGVIGLKEFFNGGDSHRNIPDAGCGTRGSDTTFNTRSILPVVTLNLGGETMPNTAPVVNNGAITKASILLGQKYAVNPEMLFVDNEGDVLTYKVSVNGQEAVEATASYKFEPQAAGKYVLTFIANDGKEEATHDITITVTVAEKPEEEAKLNFNIPENEIAGYVTVSFEDFGIRENNVNALKYPEALGMIIDGTKVPYKAGEKVSHVTIRLLEAMGIECVYTGAVDSGFYLAAIKNFVVDNTPYDKMGEFDAGSGSGWMITLNDVMINQGASDFEVKNNDVVKWKYTCQLGADIGDDYYQNVIDDVISLIDAIDVVTLNSGEKIKAARVAYDKLNDFQKKQVGNADKLIAAEKEYANLLATDSDKKAAEKVENMINAIATVTLKSEGAIVKARAAYETLTSVQKQLVNSYDKLVAAENKLNILKNPSHSEVYKATGDYIQGLGTPGVGSIGGDWMALGLARSGRVVPEGYYENVVNYVRENANEKGQLHWFKSTENSRVVLGLTAAGYDVTDVAGYNLLAPLNDMNYVVGQGINGAFWALIAFDSHNYEIPSGGNVTREALIEAILDAQLKDGGWALKGDISDPDMTGMAIQALAPYVNTNAKVKEAVNRGIANLSENQNADGSFTSIDGANVESIAQVVVALTSVGINPETDERFVKGGISLVDALCNYAIDGGGFKHTTNNKVDGMATEQGYYALIAYMRFLDGKTNLFDMSDVTLKSGVVIETKPETKPEKGEVEGAVVDNATSSSNNTESPKAESPAKTDEAITSSAKSVKEKIEEIKEIKETTEIKEVVDLIVSFMNLSKADKDSIGKDAEIEKLKEQVAKQVQTDKKTGVNVTGVEWNIKLVISEISEEEKPEASQKELEGTKELAILDINLEDMITGDKFVPTDTVTIRIPLSVVGDYSSYDGLVVVHYTDDGKVEYLNCTVNGDYVEFETSDFSPYAIVGYNGKSPIEKLTMTDGTSNNGASWLPWGIAGGCFVIFFAVMFVIAGKKRRHIEK